MPNGLTLYLAIALGALVLVGLPGSFQLGRWHQSAIDRVEAKALELKRTQEAKDAAQAASDRILVNVTRQTDVVRQRLEEARQAATSAEEESRAKDAELDAAQAQASDMARKLAAGAACGAPAAAPAAAPDPAPAPTAPTISPFRAAPSCSGFDDDDLRRLRQRYPAGPVRRSSGAAAPRRR